MSEIINAEKIKELSPNQKAERFLKLTELKKKLNEEYDLMRKELLKQTQELGIKSLKTENYTITRANRKNISIIDHQVAGKELEKLGYQIRYEEVISDLSMPTVKEVAKNQDIEGIEVNETEYILVRINKEN